jgi:hypothetical protein
MAEGVFVSYRRDDAPGHAGRLYDCLVSRFGKDRVFMDVDSVEPGEDFLDAIELTLADASVVVVVIGPTWVTARDERGVVRLTKPDDFVHLEVGRALQLQKRVIPVLVDDAPVPESDELPQDLRPLTRRNAFELSDGRFHSDANRLADAIERSLTALSSADAVGAPATPDEPDVARPQRVAPAPQQVAPAPQQVVAAPGQVDPAPERDRKGDRVRRLALPVGIAVVIALILVIGAIVWTLSSGDDPAADPDSTGVSSASEGSAAAPAVPAPSVVDDFQTTGEPKEIVVAGGSLWATYDGGVEQFTPPGPDAESSGLVDLGSAGYGNDMIVRDDTLYVIRYQGQAVAAVDLATGDASATPVSLEEYGPALSGVISGDTLWLTVHGSSSDAPGSVVAIRDGEVVDEIPLEQKPYQIEAVGDQLWVTYFETGRLGLIDPTTREDADFAVGEKPVDVRLIADQLWVTVSGEDRIALVDPASGTEKDEIEVGDAPWKLEEGFGAVWVSNQGDGQTDGSVMPIDPTSHQVGDAIGVGVKPDAIAVGDDHVFVGNLGSGSISVIDPG